MPVGQQTDRAPYEVEAAPGADCGYHPEDKVLRLEGEFRSQIRMSTGLKPVEINAGFDDPNARFRQSHRPFQPGLGFGGDRHDAVGSDPGRQFQSKRLFVLVRMVDGPDDQGPWLGEACGQRGDQMGVGHVGVNDLDPPFNDQTPQRPDVGESRLDPKVLGHVQHIGGQPLLPETKIDRVLLLEVAIASADKTDLMPQALLAHRQIGRGFGTLGPFIIA